MSKRSAALTGLLWGATVVGAGLLVTGLAMHDPVMREKSAAQLEEDQSTDPDTPKEELTTAGGLIIFGALGTSMIIPAIGSSAKARDSRDHVGEVSLTSPSGETVECSRKPASSVQVFLAKEQGDADNVNTSSVSESRPALQATTDANGEVTFSLLAVQSAFCPDDDDTVYYVQFPKTMGKITEKIHPVCAIQNAQRDRAVAVTRFDELLVNVRTMIDSISSSFVKARSILDGATPLNSEQVERLQGLKSYLSDRVMDLADSYFKSGDTGSALSTIQGIENYTYSPQQQERSAELYRRIQKAYPAYEKREERLATAEERKRKLAEKKAEREAALETKRAEIQRQKDEDRDLKERVAAQMDNYKQRYFREEGRSYSNKEITRRLVSKCENLADAEACFFVAMIYGTRNQCDKPKCPREKKVNKYFSLACILGVELACHAIQSAGETGPSNSSKKKMKTGTVGQ